MNSRKIAITREELYLEVWSAPMRTLAEKYGISDVGLAKKCRKHLIPLPGRGFWAKKESGKLLPKQPLLKKLNKNQQHLGTIHFYNHSNDLLKSSTKIIDEISKYEKLDENKITVNFGAELKHPLVLRTAKSIRSSKSNEKQLLTPKAKKCLDLSVSKNCIERALNILDSLAIALENRGYKFIENTDKNDGRLILNVDDIPISFTLEEYIQRVEIVLTPEEEKKVSKKQRFRYRFPQYEYYPTGKLVLKINNVWQYHGRKSWSDAKVQRVENCLNDFVIALRKCASAIKAKKEENERRDRQYEELRRRKEIFLQKKLDEQNKLTRLVNDSTDWKKSQLFRNYIDAVKLDTVTKFGEIPIDSEIEAWIRWANHQADRIDPLKESVQSILDMEFSEFNDDIY